MTLDTLPPRGEWGCVDFVGCRQPSCVARGRRHCQRLGLGRCRAVQVVGVSVGGLFITMGAALGVMLLGGVVSRAAMATARRRMREQGMLERLQSEDPTPETVWTLTHQGAASGPFRVAYAAYRAGTAAGVVFYGLGVFIAFGMLGVGIAYGQARGDVIGPRSVDWRLVVGGPLVIAYLCTALGTRAARALSVWRRSCYFPEGLAYAYLVSQRVRTDWRKVPPPRPDPVADLYEQWSGRLDRAAMRLAAPAMIVALVVGIAHVLART